MTKRTRDEEDDGGAWRARLPAWTVPPAPGRMEAALREQFRRRHRRAALELWAGRAAVFALVTLVVLGVRLAQRSTAAIDAPPRSVAALDLAGFEPVGRLRIVREVALGEAALDGFEPVVRMTITRREGGLP